MTKVKIHLQPAYILHSRPYRNTSRILEAYTQDQGRVGLIAKGIRRGKRQGNGLIQPFSPILISWVGRSELMTATNIEANGLAHTLKGNALLCGFYLNELLIRLLHHHDPHPALFHYYHETLTALAQDKHHEKTLRHFEKALLKELGYGFHLNQDTHSNAPIQENNYYLFDPQSGLRHIKEDLNQDNTFLGKHLLSIAQDDFNDKDVLGSAKRLFRIALMPLLGNKPLKTRELFI